MPLPVIAVSFLVLGFWDLSPDVPLLAVALVGAAFLAGDALGRRPGAVVLIGSMAMISAHELAAGRPGNAVWMACALVLPAWGLARLARSRRLRVEEIQRLNGELERTREQAAELAAEAERSRIARELHDTLAHGLTLMTLQATAGEALAGTDAAAARRALAAIEDCGRAALAELDGIYEQADVLAPPTLDELIDSVRAAGLRARLEVVGADRHVPDGVVMAAHRIVQEAVTNAVRHAAASELTIRLSRGPDVMEVQVVDNGAGGVAPAAPAGGGRGLIGMRERASMYGGSLEAGPRPSGGFSVRARLPLADPA